jgi:hypothetical protein
VPPGGTKTYRWYAGDIDAVPDPTTSATNDYNLVATPIEFGATGLMPADRIKGSNKGLVGALIIEPQGSTWVEDPGSRTSATVTKSDGSTRFREFVTILQNDLNLRYTADNVTCTPAQANLFCAVPNIHAEGGFVPEDPQDSAQKAINYGADPIWFRLGVAPETPFDQLLDRTDIHLAFANELAGADNPATVAIENDPQTAVFLASPSGAQDVRMRVIAPGGHSRGIVYTLNGHSWQREPYVNGSTEIGENPLGWWNAAQEGIGAGSAININVQRGGYFNVEGDYLFRDHGSFGTYQGLWGIMRHAGSAPQAAPDFYGTPKNVTLSVAAPGVLSNDVDVDGSALTAQLVAGSAPAGGTLSLSANGSFTYVPALDTGGEVTFQYVACQADAVCSAPTTVYIRVGSPPVAVADAYAVTAGTTLSVPARGVLANDTDADGDVLGAVLGTGPTHADPALGDGAFALNPDGSFLYIPDPTYVGTDSFTYRACETTTVEQLCSAPVTVTLTANGAPAAGPDSYDVLANKTLSVASPGVLGNDSDPNGDALRAERVAGTGPTRGTLTLNANGSFTYVPEGGFAGSDTFQYKACESATTLKLCSPP